MNFRNTLIASFSTLLLASAATAQLGQIGQFNRLTFTTQQQGGAYDRSIGNSWLGASVHAQAYLTTTTGLGYESGAIDCAARASASLLGQSATVAEVATLLRNTMQNNSQTRTGSFRVTLLGYNYVNQSFTNDSSFAQRTWTYNLFPVAPSASVPVGPFSLTVSGNAGASLTVSGNFFLPAATPQVTLAGTGRIYANANADVSIGIPGVSVGVGIEGRVCDTTLTAWATASARTGFSGLAQVRLTAVAIRLYAFIDTFLHDWTTNLSSWSSAPVNYTLF